MSGPATAQTPQRNVSRFPLRQATADAALAVVAVAALLLTASLIASPRHIDHLTFVNPTDYDIAIDVSGESAGRWVAVGTAGRRSTAPKADVLDQGDSWFFRFSSQGERSSDLIVQRSQLERDSWTVHIPDEIGQQLRAGGAPPSP